MKTGYKIIDLKDVKLINQDPTTSASESIGVVEGVYEAIEGNYRKLLVLSGVNLNGTMLSNIAVNLKPTTVTFGGEAVNCFAGNLALVGTTVDTIYIIEDDRVFYHEA